MRFILLSLGLTALSSATERPLSYNRDIRPILAENCFACHGPDKASRKGKLRLDLRDAALEKVAFVPGDAESSELFHLIHSDDEEEIMPPPESHKSLKAEEKRTLEEWINQGAIYEPHWAYIKPERPSIPDLGAKHPIDNFILAGLKPEQLDLSPPAEPSVLARRLSFDLSGLPPFLTGVSDPMADLGSLLDSPHFGERMAVYWLDLARYADTVGYHADVVRDVTPYRDYVVNSFNRNKPYNEFIIEQLAGDLLENPTVEQYVATGFNRINQVSAEGGIQDLEYVAKYYAERVRTTSVAFLGSTMGCAECHDHKFDPFTAKDFYAMEAFFADIFEKGAYNGDGRYNEGADIEDYAGFSLSRWGPAISVPEEREVEGLARLSNEKKKLQAQLNLNTPELHAAFTAWVEEIRSKLGSNEGQDVVILEDDEFPLGGAKTVSENVHSGKLARFQKHGDLVQHIVDLGKGSVSLDDGDSLFAWVWLDPTDPPKQVMLQFQSDKNWAHRVWWGADLIPYGKGSKKTDHHYGGKLPELGKWVRLEVPAAKVGLSAGKAITHLAYTQHGGTVLWDLAGRHTDPANALLSGLPAKLRAALVEGRELNKKELGQLRSHYIGIAPGLDPVKKEIAKLTKEEAAMKGRIRTTLVTLSAKPREVRLLPRGDWTDKSGELLEPAVPGFLTMSGDQGEAGLGQRLTRLDLARWIASPDNPLTARAFVNRVWALFFGNGLSRDLQDLGNQGRWPSHPELLDWLAVEFMESGWDVKHLVKTIVTSRTYQQSSNPSAELLERDPYNELYAFQNPRRLPAEFVRDNALAVSGLLNTKVGGGSARPYQPAGYYAQLNFPKREYQAHLDSNQYRRGLYMHWQRTFLHPMLAAFDAPAREECTASRALSNTPLQALDLLNDPTFVEAARVLAQELVAKHPQLSARLDTAFMRLLERSPSNEEITLLNDLYTRQLERYRESAGDAKELLEIGLTPPAADLDAADLAATTAVMRVLLNLHETITRY